MTKHSLNIVTDDGTARANLFMPGTPVAARSAVLLYMDGIGFRPALEGMAERFAGAGYTVRLPDLFYRAGPYDPIDAKTAFANDDSKARIMGLACTSVRGC